MQVMFNFMKEAKTYVLELPDYFESAPEMTSAFEFNGVHHSVQYRSGTDAPADLPASSRAQALPRGASSLAPVNFRRADAPVLDLPTWAVGAGVVWTQVEPAAEGRSAAATVAQSMSVSTGPVGLPVLKLSGRLGHGDTRTDLNRDNVMYYAKGEGVPWSIRLNKADGMSRDSDITVDDVFIAQRGTALGITVCGDGSREQATLVKAATETIAASLGVR